MSDSTAKKKITWKDIINAIIQAAIAALTALGVTSCSPAMIQMLP